MRLLYEEQLCRSKSNTIYSLDAALYYADVDGWTNARAKHYSKNREIENREVVKNEKY